MKLNLDEKRIIPLVIFFVVVGIFIIIATAVIYFINGHLNFNDIDTEKLVAFGGFIGGLVGTIFTLAVLFLVWLTYSNQKTELAETVKIARIQSSTLKIQQFENTYFNLLRNLNIIIDNMISKNYDKKGRTYLHELFEMLSSEIDKDSEFQTLKMSTRDTTNPEELEVIKTIIINLYDKIFEENSYNLGHYFRFIHNIIKYLNRQLSDDKESRQKYASFLQAQLSNDELAFILYNSLSKYSIDKYGKSTFKNFIDEYGILENIDDYCIFHPQLDKLFPKTNFFYKR